MLETLDYTIRIGSIPTFLYFDCISTLPAQHTSFIPSITIDCSVDSYVDDSKALLSFPVDNKIEVKAKMEYDINKIIGCCCTNSLLINPDKTKLLLYLHGTQQLMNVSTGCLSLNILGKTIESVSSAKDLGVILDSHNCEI